LCSSDSEATNFRPPGHGDDENGATDVFKWYQLTGNTALESRDFENRFIGSASQHPTTGLHGTTFPTSRRSRIDEHVRARVSSSEIPS